MITTISCGAYADVKLTLHNDDASAINKGDCLSRCVKDPQHLTGASNSSAVLPIIEYWSMTSIFINDFL